MQHIDNVKHFVLQHDTVFCASEQLIHDISKALRLTLVVTFPTIHNDCDLSTRRPYKILGIELT
jgi:hypothetical protein